MSSDALERVVARSDIQQLAYRYARALERRDVDAMVELFVPDARFGPFGEGVEALRALTEASLAASPAIVVLVANHVIDVHSSEQATGEVWARCYAQTIDEGYTEQLLRYEDEYRVHDGTWRFVHRRHRLWFGTAPHPSPFGQEPANWPERQTGVGDAPFDSDAFVAWYRERSGEA